MRIDVVTIFPEYLEPMRQALLGKAIEQGILSVGVYDLRDWTHDVHKAVDDTPYGGGPGMVMKPTVWGAALDDVRSGTGVVKTATDLSSASEHRGSDDHAGKRSDGNAHNSEKPLLIVPSPAGKPFTQAMAQEFSEQDHIVFACGRYEGIDQRVMEYAQREYRVEEVSVGDYVLIGGEVATLVMTEAIVRLIPGVLGNQRSHEEDSFQDGLLEGPNYTKPRVWEGLEVPEVLLSGDHAKVDRWRRDQSLLRTQECRPDLLEHVQLSPRDQQALDTPTDRGQ